jgi:hypothetical protein
VGCFLGGLGLAIATIGGYLEAALLQDGAELTEKLQIAFSDALSTGLLVSLANTGVIVLVVAACAAAPPVDESAALTPICACVLSAFAIQSVVIGKRHHLSLWRCLRLSGYCALAWLVIFSTMGFFACYAILAVLGAGD